MGSMLKSLFIENVCAEMEKKGWRPAELARRAGQTPQNLGPLLKGKRRYHQADVEGIAAALGVPVFVLFMGEGDRVAHQQEREYMNKIREMIEAMIVCPDIEDVLLAKFKEARVLFAEQLNRGIEERKKKVPSMLHL